MAFRGRLQCGVMTRWLPFILVFSAVTFIIYAADMRLHPRFFHWVATVPHLDKALHFALMGLLAWAANLALNHHRFRLGPLHLLTGSVVIAVIVAAEEISQAWFPARSCDWRDLVADLLGITLASLLSPAAPCVRSEP